MLEKVTIQRYKSLFDVTLDFEPLTVLLGPDGSGKSTVSEALFVLSHLLKWRGKHEQPQVNIEPGRIIEGAARLPKYQNWVDKFWRKQTEWLAFKVAVTSGATYDLHLPSASPLIPAEILQVFNRVVVYHFSAALLSQEGKPNSLAPTGEGIGNSLAAIARDKPAQFSELQHHLSRMVPQIAGISLKEQLKNHRTYYELYLVDKYSGLEIPSSEVSDGALRILAFLTALYQVDTPTILCFEEIENGLHPHLVQEVFRLLNQAAREGIGGQRVQILLTTHSPVLLGCVKPEQVRVVELNHEGQTFIHPMPTDPLQFEQVITAYRGELGESWFSCR